MELKLVRAAEECVRGYLDLQLTNKVKAYVNHKLTKVYSGREFFFSREISNLAKNNYQRMSTITNMEYSEEGFVKDLEEKCLDTHFSKVFISPQGQLCLELNRPITFSECLARVAQEGERYGFSDSPESTQNGCVTLSHCTCGLQHLSTTKFSSSQSTSTMVGCGFHGCHGDSVSLEEGRIIVLEGVLSNTLRATGYKVHYHPCKKPVEEELKEFLVPYTTSKKDQSNCPDEPELQISDFLSSLIKSTYHIPLPKEQMCDSSGGSINVRQFLMDQQLLVSDSNESLSLPCRLAYEECKSRSCTFADVSNDANHVICHVTPTSKSFILQQSLALQALYEHSAEAIPTVQCILVCGGVECVRGEGGEREVHTSLADLLRVRREQVSALCAARYAEQAEGEQLQGISAKIARAVVVFELLSSDHHKTVKITLPKNSGTMGVVSGCVASDGMLAKAAGLSGASVLYNYARLASLLRRHGQLVQRGVYPRLPPVDQVDFSLLTDEAMHDFLSRKCLPAFTYNVSNEKKAIVEWQLLFHFVLHFPTVVAEAAIMRHKGGGGGGEGAVGGRGGVNSLIHVDVSIKKICLFLVALIHLFSPYYCRVKVLMCPEPHLLALIHARLHLVSALRQVMFNALTLLGITPLDEL